MSKKKGSVNRDAAWLAEHLRRHPEAATEETARVLSGVVSPLAQTLADLGLGHRQRKSADKPSSGSGLSTKKSYITSLLEAVETSRFESYAELFPDGSLRELVVWFDGARMLTINQMISLFTNRQFQYFKYKNRWRKQMRKAIETLRLSKEITRGFEHPVKIEVMRHATRMVDRDALPTMFKILIDTLRHEENAIIRDDNPDEVVDVLPYQKKIYLNQDQRPGVGLRVVAQPNWVPDPIPDVAKEWLRKHVQGD